MTKKAIIQEIKSHWSTAQCVIEKTALGKGIIQVRCWHGDCERIGQFMMRSFGNVIQTYFACHEFKKGHLAIYFKR